MTEEEVIARLGPRWEQGYRGTKIWYRDPNGADWDVTGVVVGFVSGRVSEVVLVGEWEWAGSRAP